LNLQALYQNVSIFRNDICKNDNNSENNSLKKKRGRERGRRRGREEEDSACATAISLYGIKAFRGVVSTFRLNFLIHAGSSI